MKILNERQRNLETTKLLKTLLAGFQISFIATPEGVLLAEKATDNKPTVGLDFHAVGASVVTGHRLSELKSGGK